MKAQYGVQPLLIGGARKSLYFLVPVDIVRAFNLDCSSIFVITPDLENRRITLSIMEANKKERPDGIAVPSVESAVPQNATTGVDENG
jgi:hypothetical protein